MRGKLKIGLKFLLKEKFVSVNNFVCQPKS